MNKIKWIIEKRKIKDLIPYDKNPRRLTEKQAEQLKKSIERFNLVEIPVIDTDGVIIAGHQRLKIMQMIGRGNELIECRVPAKPLTAKQVEEYNVRSNKNTGEWDFDVLANEFDVDELLDWGFDKKNLGFDGDETPPGGDSNTVKYKEMKFLFTEKQSKTIKKALKTGKAAGFGTTEDNENINGSVLFEICKVYIKTTKRQNKQ